MVRRDLVGGRSVARIAGSRGEGARARMGIDVEVAVDTAEWEPMA
jgi:hypothetical protein